MLMLYDFFRNIGSGIISPDFEGLSYHWRKAAFSFKFTSPF